MLFKKEKKEINKREKGFQKFVEFTSTFSREDNPSAGMGGGGKNRERSNNARATCKIARRETERLNRNGRPRSEATGPIQGEFRINAFLIVT